MLLGKKINLTFNVNVNKAFSIFDNLLKRIENKDYDYASIPDPESNRKNWQHGYDGKTYGWGLRLDSTNNKYKDNAREGYAHLLDGTDEHANIQWLYGPIVRSVCPWIPELNQLSGDLNFIEVGLQRTLNAGMPPHIDQPEADLPVTRITTILYQDDPDAHLTVWNAGREKTQLLRDSSEARKNIEHINIQVGAGESYILDTKKTHAVYNTKKRLILSVRFDNDIKTVYEHFEKLGSMTLR